MAFNAMQELKLVDSLVADLLIDPLSILIN